jgi:NAD+ kinase
LCVLSSKVVPMRVHILTSDSPKATEGFRALQGVASVPYEQAEALLVLGGDGFMLEAIRRFNPKRLPIYGMNLGTVGFLLNPFQTEGVVDRIARAVPHRVVPLRATVTHLDGTTTTVLAINDVSLMRAGPQSAHIRIAVNGVERIERLVADGVLLATPAGSTAYNASAGGPILPLDSNVLPLSAIAAYRPRHWKGAVLPDSARVVLTALDTEKRPLTVYADGQSVEHVAEVAIAAAHDTPTTLLFDSGVGLEERLIAEQFL